MQDYTIPHKEKLLEIIENYLLCEYKKKITINHIWEE